MNEENTSCGEHPGMVYNEDMTVFCHDCGEVLGPLLIERDMNKDTFPAYYICMLCNEITKHNVHIAEIDIWVCTECSMKYIRDATGTSKEGVDAA
jgi:hypothetical protein